MILSSILRVTCKGIESDPIFRVRENRMHGLMREGRREPVLYSTGPLRWSDPVVGVEPVCVAGYPTLLMTCGFMGIVHGSWRPHGPLFG